MEDLAEKLNQVLNDPQAMEQVNSLMQMLGSGGGAPAPKATSVPQSAPDLTALTRLLGGQPKQQTAIVGNQPELMQTVMKILPLLQSIQEDDDSTRLLRSLRPMLGKERQKRLDEVTKLMQIFRLLPLLRSGGVL